MIFFFNDTATTEIYTLSLHDALPISREGPDRDAEFTRHCTKRQRLRPFPVEHADGALHDRSEEHTSELQSHLNLVCRLLLEKKNTPREAPISMVSTPMSLTISLILAR